MAAFVDVNPRKHQLVAPGVGLRVIAPSAVSGVRPDLVLISNTLYATEIAVELQKAGLSAELSLLSARRPAPSTNGSSTTENKGGNA